MFSPQEVLLDTYVLIQYAFSINSDLVCPYFNASKNDTIHDWISDMLITVIKYFQVSKITQFSRVPTKFIKL